MGSATGQPEIILTDTPGKLLKLDLLAYPEDTYLVVDPYSPVDRPKDSLTSLIGRAEQTLPRALGEIIPARAKGVAAKRILRLVLLDFNQRRSCQTAMVGKTLRRIIHEAASLGAGHVGLDCVELLAPCISAYRVLSCLCREAKRAHPGLKSLTLSVHQPAALRRYQLALNNLPEE